MIPKFYWAAIAGLNVFDDALREEATNKRVSGKETKQKNK